MTARPDRSAPLWLSAQQLTQPELLEGLAVWLQLGLLTDAQVRQFCQDYLICSLPDPAPAPPPPLPPPPTAVISPANRVARSLRSFMAEISVIWLLFLGVFLVVVSSGVLAASQWQNFSPIGQYSILLVYTLGFWGASTWAARRQNLRWTGRMLQIATLLILPVNFWMIDGLKLWQSPAGGVVAAIATLVLTAVTIFLLKPGSDLTAPQRPYLPIVNSIGLDWLHWGWGSTGVPLTATYIGTIGTALLLFCQFRTHPGHPDAGSTGASSAPDAPPLDPRLAALPRPATLVTIFAALLLIGRAVLAAQIPLSQVGLALGLCGWLLGWLTRRDRSQLLWGRVGAGLLLLGWAVSVSAEPPVQAIAVSGLGLWLLADRLLTQGGSSTLTALLLVGLQAYCLLWRLLSPELRQTVIAAAIDRAGASGMPEVLLGLAGWPYLWLLLALAAWLRRQSRSRLVRQTEQVALVLGLLLSLVSLVNPVVRSLSLTLAVFTLALVLRRRVPPAFLVYLTQLVTLAAIGAWIHLVAPLDDFAWACSLLTAMAIEWGLSLRLAHPLWRRSAWDFGLVLAGLSYTLLLASTFASSSTLASGYDAVVWLVTPALLTGLSRWRSSERPLAAGLSAVALLAQLPLLRLLDAWVISLAIATGLMLVNTLSLRRWPGAALTIAFALGFEAAAICKGFASQITAEIALLLLALNLWLLWGLRNWLRQHPQPLHRLYAAAASGWAAALSLVALLILTLYSVAAYGLDASPSGMWILAAALTTGAIAYSLWQQPTDFGFYSLGWAAEALAALVVNSLGGGVEQLAIATLGLGGLAQLAGDRAGGLSRAYRSSWHGIPILYAGLGMLLGHSSFTAWTGLYSLAAALIGIGVGRRQPSFRPLTGLALLLASGAAYELLVYQLAQIKGGYPGDGVTWMAGLASAIAWADFCLMRWLCGYLRLSRNQLSLIAHLHWGFGTGLALLGLPLSLSATGAVLWVGIMASLSAYALAMGKGSMEQGVNQLMDRAARPPHRSTPGSPFLIPPLDEYWTYAGLLEAIAVLGQALYRLIPDTAQLVSGAAAIAAIIALPLYFVPWQTWGWSRRPWQTVAVLLPGVVVTLTAATVALQSLLVTAAFYAWLAKAEQRIRLSYLSIGLLDWAVLRFLHTQGWLSLLGVSGVIGGSLLYLAQVDPALQTASAREQRHWLRSLATALICLTTLYQAEIETGAAAFWVGALAIGLSIGLIFLGLILRVRAFLYLGTATFILRVLRLLWLFINSYSLLLWAVGIVLGLSLIWIAATFEARRSQMSTLLQSWLTELENWE